MLPEVPVDATARQKDLPDADEIPSSAQSSLATF
jgi:hypothetical protein